MKAYNLAQILDFTIQLVIFIDAKAQHGNTNTWHLHMDTVLYTASSSHLIRRVALCLRHH